LIKIREEDINRIKSIKTSKEKKWIINCALNIINKLNNNKDDKVFNKVNSIASRYYLQHYHNYYSNIFNNKPDDYKKEKIVRQNKLRKLNQPDYKKNYDRYGRGIMRLYREGKLSNESINKIEEKLGKFSYEKKR
jgi:hypothetical protein